MPTKGKKTNSSSHLKIKILGKTNKIPKHSHRSLSFVCMFKIDMYQIGLDPQVFLNEICCSHFLKVEKTPIKDINAHAVVNYRGKELVAVNYRGKLRQLTTASSIGS